MPQTALTIFNQVKEEIQVLYPPKEAASVTYWLLEDTLGLKKNDILTDAEAEISSPEWKNLHHRTDRLKTGEPIQHILGYAYFFDRKFRVSSAVLIPRQETEELVNWVLKSSGSGNLSVLDIGTGSGVIPISLAADNPKMKCEGWDISTEALDIAKLNSQLLEVPVFFKQQDIFRAATQQKRYDIIVSNPPYIPEMEKVQMAKNVVDFEPEIALYVPDEDPLRFYESIIFFAKSHLFEEGSLFFEINEKFGSEVISLLSDNGFTEIELRLDLNGKDRMVRGRRLGS